MAKIPQGFRWATTGKTLGQGGQAQVQLVTDSSGEYEGEYALKALSKNKPKQAYERFYREIAAIKNLDHQYIIKIFDTSEPGDEFPYYVMESIEGIAPLEKVLGTPANPYYKSPSKAVKLFIMIAEALYECQQNNPKNYT